MLLRPGTPAEDGHSGLSYLSNAANQGSAAAMLHLAKLMLEGRWLAWNPLQLVVWVIHARARALPEALALDTLFGPAGSMQAHLSEWFELPHRPQTVLRAAPLLAYVDDALPSAACRLLCERARPLLTPALVYNARSGAREQDSTRNNSAAHLGPRTLCTLLVEWRLLKHVDPDLPLARAEEVSVLHYAIGQQYHAHRDYLHPAQVDQFPPHGPGQRIRTAFAYLNQPLAGGETDFPTLGLRIEPKPGRVVVFDNVDAHGVPDPSTLHAALPVLRGEKWLATLWLRESWAR
jgi:prolyl 4-hydroxylase